MVDREKLCVLCGQSCAGQQRIKNKKGQYAHQACVNAQQGAQQEPAPSDDGGLYNNAIDDDQGYGMDDLFDDIEVGEPEMDGSASACPGCGQRMVEGAMVCMSCGYNAQSGRHVSTKSKKTKGAGSLGKVAAVGGSAASPMVPFIGALIGGAIGAAIWAAISYFFNYEIGYIAWGIGGLVGLGASIGPADGQGGGAITGAMAAIVAMASIAGGKYAASYFSVQDAFGGFADSEPMTVDDVDDLWFHYGIAFDITEELIEDGETLDWGEPSVFVDAAYWPEAYPSSIQDETLSQWNEMSGGEQRSYRKKLLDEANEEYDDYILRDVTEEWALSSLVDEICNEKIAKGITINWPDPNLPMGMGEWPEGFPERVQTQTLSQIESMSEDAVYDFKQEMVTSANKSRAEFANIAHEITQESFIQSFMHPFDLIFMFLAVITAYGIASNEG